MRRPSPLALAVGALTVAAFAARLVRLLSSPEPFGTDGYYYVVQVERLLSTGHLHAPDGSWVLPFLAVLAAPFRDVVAGVKVGQALLAALCIPAAAFAGARLGRSGALPLAVWAALSPTLAQLAAEFPKSVGLVAPAFLALGLALSPPWRGRLVLLLLALLATATAHRMGAALAGLAIPGALAGLLARRAGSTRKDMLRLSIAGGGALALFAAATLALPNLLHPADVDRLAGQLSFSLQWPSPLPYLARHPFHWLEAVELFVPWAALVAGAIAFLRAPERRPVLGALMVPLAACVLVPWRADVLDVGYRLALVAPFVGVALLAAAAPAAISFPGPSAIPLWPSVVMAGLLAFPFARAGAVPERKPPYARYRALVARLPQPLPELLIAHQGLAFLYDHVTGRDAMSWAPEPALDRRRVGRIAWGIRPGEWDAWAPKLPDARIVRLDADYAYVREDVWEEFVARAAIEGDDDLSERLADWRNPSRVRPESLARNHR